MAYKMENCIQLFVNVYGDGYKNISQRGQANHGKSIVLHSQLYFFANIFWGEKWFAQSRQWEGTEVIQEMIYSAGSVVEHEDGTVSEDLMMGPQSYCSVETLAWYVFPCLFTSLNCLANFFSFGFQ